MPKNTMNFERSPFMVRPIREDDVGYILQTFLGGLRFSRPWDQLHRPEVHEVYGTWVRALLASGDMAAVVLCDRADSDLIIAYALFMDRWMPHGRGVERVIVWVHTRKPFRGRGIARGLFVEMGRPSRLMFVTKSYPAWRGRGIYSYWANPYRAQMEEKREREREIEAWVRRTGQRTAELQQAALEEIERSTRRGLKEANGEGGAPGSGAAPSSDG